MRSGVVTVIEPICMTSRGLEVANAARVPERRLRVKPRSTRISTAGRSRAVVAEECRRRGSRPPSCQRPRRMGEGQRTPPPPDFRQCRQVGPPIDIAQNSDDWRGERDTRATRDGDPIVERRGEREWFGRVKLGALATLRGDGPISMERRFSLSTGEAFPRQRVPTERNKSPLNGQREPTQRGAARRRWR